MSFDSTGSRSSSRRRLLALNPKPTKFANLGSFDCYA
jgi:hypothetical protein